MSVTSLVALFERHATLSQEPVLPLVKTAGTDFAGYARYSQAPPRFLQSRPQAPAIIVQAEAATGADLGSDSQDTNQVLSLCSPDKASKRSFKNSDCQTTKLPPHVVKGTMSPLTITEQGPQCPPRAILRHSMAQTQIPSISKKAVTSKSQSNQALSSCRPTPSLSPQAALGNTLATIDGERARISSAIPGTEAPSCYDASLCDNTILASPQSISNRGSSGHHVVSPNVIFANGASINDSDSILCCNSSHPERPHDPWELPRLPRIRSLSPILCPKPKPSFQSLSSLDNLLSYHEERSEWKRASSILRGRSSQSRLSGHEAPEQVNDCAHANSTHTSVADMSSLAGESESGRYDGRLEKQPFSLPSFTYQDKHRPHRFRHFAAEIGFCFTIAMTQFLAEYLISGFAIILPKLTSTPPGADNGSLGSFWPATLLSLVMSATLLVFARLSDMHGGYPYFMFGVFWLAIWTLIPGFFDSIVLLDVARAMQGLAIAAFTPSTFSMVGSIYSEGPRRNFVLGLYGAMAPLGFFAGFLAGGVLDYGNAQWYNWGASILAFVVAVIGYMTVPTDRTNRKNLNLRMDWTGAFLITSGLILVAYALAVEPYVNQLHNGRSSFSSPMVYGPFVSGVVCLLLAVYVEGWFAQCPLLPFDFFKPKNCKSLSVACLCFYACYGAWLYNSAEYFRSSSATGKETGVDGLELALWYTPTAVGGIFFCVASSALLHLVPIKLLLLVSALGWIGAPLILAVSPTPMQYWNTVLPSTICATLGIDLTFTISIVFMSSCQPLRYQGLAGAVCSILVNLAMSFALPISEIISQKATVDFVRSHTPPETGQDGNMAKILEATKTNWGYQTTFIYAAASAGLGFIICVLLVNISRSVVSENVAVEEDGTSDDQR